MRITIQGKKVIGSFFSSTIHISLCNRCTCDVPSHTYQFSWAPNHFWSKLYPPATEILEYLNNVVDNHDLRKYMHFDVRCTSATWSDDESRWTTTLQHTKTHENRVTYSDVFIYAVGRLNNSKIPLIEGIDSFQGVTAHTAAWPQDLEVAGKQVAVIGNGASAVQCVAALQPSTNPRSSIIGSIRLIKTHLAEVSKLINIFRGPTWIVPHVFSEDGSVQSECKLKKKNSCGIPKQGTRLPSRQIQRKKSRRLKTTLSTTIMSERH